MVTRWSDIFSDLGFKDASVMRLKSRLAMQIVTRLQGLSVRSAAKEADTPAADISRIRNARLDRFSIDRLMTIAARLGCDSASAPMTKADANPDVVPDIVEVIDKLRADADADRPWFIGRHATKEGLSEIEDGRQDGMFPVTGEAAEINLIVALHNAWPVIKDALLSAEFEGPTISAARARDLFLGKVKK